MNSGVIKGIIGAIGLVGTGAVSYICGRRAGAHEAYCECKKILEDTLGQIQEGYSKMEKENEKGVDEEEAA